VTRRVRRRGRETVERKQEYCGLWQFEFGVCQTACDSTLTKPCHHGYEEADLRYRAPKWRWNVSIIYSETWVALKISEANAMKHVKAIKLDEQSESGLHLDWGLWWMTSSQVKLLTTSNSICIAQRVTAQSKTGIFRGYGKGEAPPFFKPTSPTLRIFFTFFARFICSSGISEWVYVLIWKQCRIGAQPRSLVVKISVSLFELQHNHEKFLLLTVLLLFAQ
jgi:hypothetical protein